MAKWYCCSFTHPCQLAESGLNLFRYCPEKALTPNDFPNLQAAEKRLLDFEKRYQGIARPFKWKFTRKGLKEKLKLVGDHIIEQHQPITSQDSINKATWPWDEIQGAAYAYK